MNTEISEELQDYYQNVKSFGSETVKNPKEIDYFMDYETGLPLEELAEIEAPNPAYETIPTYSPSHPFPTQQAPTNRGPIAKITVEEEMLPSIEDKPEPLVEATPSQEKLFMMQKAMDDLLALDDKIKELSAIMKVLRTKKKAIENYLQRDMQVFQVGYLSKGTEQLRYSVSRPKKGYNKDFIRMKLTEKLKDVNLAKEITEYLEESRPRNERIHLKREKCVEK